MIDFDEVFEVEKNGLIKTIIATQTGRFYSVTVVRRGDKIDGPFTVSENIIGYLNDLRTYCHNYQIEFVEYKRGKS